MPTETVLLVDDEPHIIELARMYLEQEGYQILEAADGQEALDVIGAEQPDIIVLDLMLPVIDGWDICKRTRAHSDVPIIMLTARDDDIDKIVGLELGADDYMTKPFNPRELVARIKAILRRAAPPAAQASSSPLQIGDVTIDPARREAWVKDTALSLRAKEFDLLYAFVQHPGLVMDREQLLNLVWGFDFLGQTRTVDVHVAHLRARLSDAASDVTIETVWGVGYKLVV
ncbi:MAG: response regulator transcription factor [Chloroflexi bacterium]|nr:response regulator transcription factor [Chloroflexota bacterium]